MSIELTPKAQRERDRITAQAVATVAALPIRIFGNPPKRTARKLRVAVHQYRQISILRAAIDLMVAHHEELLDSIPLDDLGDAKVIDLGAYAIGRHPHSGKVRIFPTMQPSEG